MIQRTTLIILTLAFVAGCALFYTSEKVDKAKRQYYTTQHQLSQEKETIRVLQAEWSYLTAPERIEKLADEYLRPLDHAPNTTPEKFITPPGLDNLREKSAEADKWEAKSQMLIKTALLHQKTASPAQTPTVHIRPANPAPAPIRIKVKPTLQHKQFNPETLPSKPNTEIQVHQKAPKLQKSADDFQAVLRNLERP